MRQIKLPHLPSDVEARQSDLLTDLWYKNGKTTNIKQDIKKVKNQDEEHRNFWCSRFRKGNTE